jgi:hypothetical protein
LWRAEAQAVIAVRKEKERMLHALQFTKGKGEKNRLISDKRQYRIYNSNK